MKTINVKTNKFEYTITFNGNTMSMSSTDKTFNFENQSITSETDATNKFKFIMKCRGEEIIEWNEVNDTDSTETFVKDTIVEYLNETSAIHTYKDYWKHNNSFEAFFEFNGEIFNPIVIKYGEYDDETILSVENDYIDTEMEIYDDTPEYLIKDFIAKAIAETVYKMVQ